jgi:hypothetical protein
MNFFYSKQHSEVPQHFQALLAQEEVFLDNSSNNNRHLGVARHSAVLKVTSSIRLLNRHRVFKEIFSSNLVSSKLEIYSGI